MRSKGFERLDAEGNWSGFDIDFCRAIAAAIFGDPDKVEFVPVSTRQRFEALENGSIDVLDRTTTWTLSRETSHRLLFTGISYYDGQGFMVRRDLKVASAANLSSDQICVAQDTTTELNLADYFRQRGLKYAARSLPGDEAEAAYAAGQMRGGDDGRLGFVRATLQASASRRQRHPAGDHLQGAARDRPCARATTAGLRSCAGP